MATVRSAIYARLSVDRDGTKVGIDTQLEDSRRLARERGWEITAEYVDRNLTAADKLVKRPEYSQLVEDFGSGRFDALICWDLDRLTRQPRQLEDWIDAAEDRGLRIVTANGEADLSTDAGRLFARIKASVAKSEAERASARQKRNKQYRREHGLFHGGPAPYGYRAEDKTLVPAPEEVELIHEAARRLLDNRESMHSIVTDWNSGSPAKRTTRGGNHWRQPNLRSILLNRAMLGETKAGVAGWEPIIDRRTFDRLTALLTDPSRKATHSPGVKGGKYSMGGGLTVCAICGKPLITAGKPRPSKDGPQRQVALSCLRRVNGPSPKHEPVEKVRRVYFGKDGQRVRSKAEAVRSEEIESLEDTGRVTVDHDSLEEYVFGQAIEWVTKNPRWSQRMAEQDPVTDAKLDALETERSELRADREHVAGLLLDRHIDASRVRERIDAIDTELDRIEREYSATLGRPAIGQFLKDGIDWKSWSPGLRRTFLRLIIERVEVGPYPTGPGTARRSFRKSGESDENYFTRQRQLTISNVAARTTIVWR